MDGNFKNAFYYTTRSTDFAPDGSLIINSYEDSNAGEYLCDSEYRSIFSELITFGMYNPRLVDVIIQGSFHTLGNLYLITN